MSAQESPLGGRATDERSVPAPGVDLEHWRREGRCAGEAYERRLRAFEAQERSVHVARILRRTPSEPAAPASPAQVDSWRLERELELFHDFHRALSRSRAWRLVQALRRPLGRDW
jgi:hypothetical protein